MPGTFRACLLAALMLAGAAGAAASAPSWYSCTCPTHNSSGPCICPSTSPPGGLAPANTPQFVLFTHDDAITPTTYQVMQAILKGKQSRNGCPAVATMFTTFQDTDCAKLRSLHQAGYEIADHTLTHAQMNGLPRAQVVQEVVGARQRLSSACGIPAADIAGFRQPYLQASPAVRQVLAEAGFLYDATLLEEPSGASLTRGMAARVWPYTLQDGIPQNCAWYEPAQSCDPAERYPGMFEVPVWGVNAAGLFSMDYGDSQHDAYSVLRATFDAAYGGNRAPVPVFIHTPWLQANSKAMQRFADYALSKPDVYFVTIRQLLAWMQHPVPSSQLTPASLGCGNAGGAGPAPVSTRSTSLGPSPTPAAPPSASPTLPPPPPLPSLSLSLSPPPAPVILPESAAAVGAAPAPVPAPAPAPIPAPAPAPAPSLAPSRYTTEPVFMFPSDDAQAQLAPAPAPAPAELPPSSGMAAAAGAAARVAAAAAAAALALALLL